MLEYVIIGLSVLALSFVVYVVYAWVDFQRKINAAEKTADLAYQAFKDEKREFQLDALEEEMEALLTRKRWGLKDIPPQQVNGVDRSE